MIPNSDAGMKMVSLSLLQHKCNSANRQPAGDPVVLQWQTTFLFGGNCTSGAPFWKSVHNVLEAAYKIEMYF